MSYRGDTEEELQYGDSFAEKISVLRQRCEAAERERDEALRQRAAAVAAIAGRNPIVIESALVTDVIAEQERLIGQLKAEGSAALARLAEAERALAGARAAAFEECRALLELRATGYHEQGFRQMGDCATRLAQAVELLAAARGGNGTHAND